jgi:hypothetical protein
LNLNLNTNYDGDDFARLAHELFSNPKYSGKTVLIYWHHTQIPQLALALKAAAVPNEFKNNFDRVWIVTYDEQGKGRPIVERHQQLLSGDSKE